MPASDISTAPNASGAVALGIVSASKPLNAAASIVAPPSAARHSSELPANPISASEVSSHVGASRRGVATTSLEPPRCDRVPLQRVAALLLGALGDRAEVVPRVVRSHERE